MPLLSVRNLRTRFATDRGIVRAVDGVSFDLEEGEILGLVGESGSGKSVTALSVMRLVPEPPGKVTADAMTLDGMDLLGLSEAEAREIRGSRMAMIFQDPMRSLNPVLTIGRQITEVLHRHQKLAGAAARRRAVELLETVGIPMAEKRLGAYPHQFSGGMRQRVMIAIALSCNPRLLIADEATTALDVTIQAQIIDLVKRLTRERGTSVIWISHDLGVVAGLCDRVNVMYAGTRRRIGPDPRALPPAEPRLHAGPDGLDAASRRHQHAPPDADRGHAAQPDRSDSALPVPAALPRVGRGLPARAARHRASSAPAIGRPAWPTSRHERASSKSRTSTSITAGRAAR